MKNKKIYMPLLLAFLCFIIILAGCIRKSRAIEGDSDADEFKITKAVKMATKESFKTGCVKDESTAKNIAKTVFNSLWGGEYDNDKLIAEFDKKSQTWRVKRESDYDLGGDFYIIIKKSNAEVVNIWVTQ